RRGLEGTGRSVAVPCGYQHCCKRNDRDCLCPARLTSERQWLIFHFGNCCTKKASDQVADVALEMRTDAAHLTHTLRYGPLNCTVVDCLCATSFRSYTA